MSDGALKPEKDFSKETAKVIGEAEELAKVGSPCSIPAACPAACLDVIVPCVL